MNINFKRNDVQVYIENAQNCYDLEKWTTYKQKFINWEIGTNDFTPLRNCLESDLTSYFFKAFESFVQALIDVQNKKYSWAIVKLYYSTFYLLRCDILISGHLIVRCGGLYFTEVTPGRKFSLYQKNNIRGDHQLTISLVKDFCRCGKIIDPILDNNIDDVDAYTWLLQNRERINYSQKNFSEPNVDCVFSHVDTYFETLELVELLKFYKSKDYSICFDTDHSILSIPFKKMIQIFEKANGKIDISGDFLRKIIFQLNALKGCNIKKADVYSIIN